MFKNLQSNYFLRRMHSLSGIFPIGIFMVFHLFANSVSIFSADNYNLIINFLRSLPFVELIEWLGIFLPIIFHAAYGIIIYTTAKPNQLQYRYSENWRYIFQRLTGVIALVYISFHILQFKTVHNLDYNYIAESLASYQYIEFLPSIPVLNPFSIYWFYVIGLISTIYHFCNGIWSFCITWGITVGSKSQNVVLAISSVLFIALSVVSIITLNTLHAVGLTLAVN